MSERPPDPRLTNPMLQVLRQRHPDVDVVELPDPGSAPARTPDGGPGPADRDDLARTVDDALAEILARLHEEPAWPEEPETIARWRMRPDGQGHREAVSVASGLAEGDNMTLLRAAADTLLALGWQVRPVDGTSPRFIARRRGIGASVMVREGAVVLRLLSGTHLLIAEGVS